MQQKATSVIILVNLVKNTIYNQSQGTKTYDSTIHSKRQYILRIMIKNYLINGIKTIIHEPSDQ